MKGRTIFRLSLCLMVACCTSTASRAAEIPLLQPRSLFVILSTGLELPIRQAVGQQLVEYVSASRPGDELIVVWGSNHSCLTRVETPKVSGPARLRHKDVKAAVQQIGQYIKQGRAVSEVDRLWQLGLPLIAKSFYSLSLRGRDTELIVVAVGDPVFDDASYPEWSMRGNRVPSDSASESTLTPFCDAVSSKLPDESEVRILLPGVGFGDSLRHQQVVTRFWRLVVARQGAELVRLTAEPTAAFDPTIESSFSGTLAVRGDPLGVYQLSEGGHWEAASNPVQRTTMPSTDATRVTPRSESGNGQLINGQAKAKSSPNSASAVDARGSAANQETPASLNRPDHGLTGSSPEAREQTQRSHQPGTDNGQSRSARGQRSTDIDPSISGSVSRPARSPLEPNLAPGITPEPAPAPALTPAPDAAPVRRPGLTPAPSDVDAPSPAAGSATGGEKIRRAAVDLRLIPESFKTAVRQAVEGAADDSTVVMAVAASDCPHVDVNLDFRDRNNRSLNAADSRNDLGTLFASLRRSGNPNPPWQETTEWAVLKGPPNEIEVSVGCLNAHRAVDVRLITITKSRSSEMRLTIPGQAVGPPAAPKVFSLDSLRNSRLP